MGKFARFEDITAWQQGRELAQLIYRHTSAGEFARDFGLKDQLRRASTSVMSNIAEGFGRGGDREFIQFLSVANGSAREVQSHLYVALDAGFLTKEEFDRLYTLADDACHLIGGLSRYLSRSSLRGTKYRTDAE